MSFNHFSIKKQAHSLTRHDSEQSWNPFRHLSWDRRPPSRRETWDGGNPIDLEAGKGQNGDPEKLPLDHVQSEPGLHDRSPHARSRAPRPMPKLDAPSGSAIHEIDEMSPTASPASQPSPSPNGSPSDDTEEKASTTPQAASNGPTRGEGESGAGMKNRKKLTNSTMSTGNTAEKEKETAAEAVGEEEDRKKKRKQSGLIRHVKPKMPFTVANQLQRTFLNSWINILILAAPVGIAMNYTHQNGIAIFVVNFIAIIPLAAMLSFATEEIALRTGETLGGLLNATFGNAVELIVAILALAEKKVLIVQTSLIGSILSNLLLVMGFCFFFGGLRRPEQHFNTTVAQTAASLLALAVSSVIVPTVFDEWSDAGQKDVSRISRGVSIILLVVYGAYLFFQLKTHSEIFNEESQKVAAKPWRRPSAAPGPLPTRDGAVTSAFVAPAGLLSHGVSDQSERERLSRLMMHPPRIHSLQSENGESAANHHHHDSDDDDDDDDEEPQLQFAVAFATLAISTAIIALCAEAMVSSIDSVTKDGGVSEEFVGLILLPIVGNAAEHATAVTVAIKDKMDLAIGVAVGSSMQVALFLIPLLVVIGWGLGNDEMDLSFDLFQVAVLFVSVLLTNYLIGDGKSHWLEGLLLICLYAIIAVCSWWYPPPPGGEVAG